ncbi:MAG: peptidylprolyl isomerase [Nanoarchaeota archaeon]|nr:peptidylprolyl isomerase [Nanoarchaeota archaeon]
MTVEHGDTLTVSYTGKFADGEVFDSSEKQGKPLEFEIGSGKIIPGLEKALIGMKEGEKKEAVINPEDGYGKRDEELIKKVPRDGLPKDQEPRVDMMLMVGLSTGQQIPAKIVAVDEKEITLDLNHPLADKELHFDVTIDKISKKK